jgi:putative ABC transport system permease protein
VVTAKTLGARLYRLLLRLYPREFREDYGAEMTSLYRARAREEGTVSLWLALLSDLARTAPREHGSLLLRDTRYAFRGFRRTPIVTTTAVATVALAIGCATAVFSIVYGVLLRPLPYPRSDRLVELFEINPRTPGSPFMRASTLNYLSWAERVTSLEAVATFTGGDMTLTDAGTPERLSGGLVTSSMVRVLGLTPVIGRGFSTDDERPGGGRVVLLGEAFWRGRFGGNPSIVGQSLTLDGERHEVVGVLPRGFRALGRTQISTTAGDWQIVLPYIIDPTRENRGNRIVRVIGRLRPGATVASAREEMRGIAATMADEFPATNRNWGAHVESVYDSMLDERVRPSLLVVLGAVGMVLLIACANVANLLLARGIAREREWALRTALGAGRARIVRQIVTESLCLAIVSGACGLALAGLAIRAVRAVLPAGFPRSDDIGVDAAVLGVGALLALASGLSTGLVPALRSSRAALVSSLAQSGKGLTGSTRTLARSGIVAAQLAIATTLLVGAALLALSFLRLQHVSVGFEADGVITSRISLPRTAYADPARTRAFYRGLLESLSAVPRVEAVAVGLTAPFGPGVRAAGRVQDRARPPVSPEGAISAVEHMVSPDYFDVLRIPVRAGRPIGRQDGEGAPAVAVVSEGLARQLWPAANPVGQVLDWNGARSLEVVGVVGDIVGADDRGGRGGGLDRQPRAALYVSAAQFPQRTMTVLIRTSQDPAELAATLARAVRHVDPLQPVGPIGRLRDGMAESAAEPRFTAMLIGVFAIVALVLAAVGIYGVLSHSVAQRTHEIGLRMAIGARRGEVLRLVIRGGMGWAVGGIAIGLLASSSLGNALAPLLFEVHPRDPVIYSIVAMSLASVAMISCLIPAARATRIDPLTALRAE